MQAVIFSKECKLKFISTFAIVLALMGCASTPASFNQSGVPASELAVLTTKSVGLFENEVQAMVVGVYDVSGKQLIGFTSMFEQDRWETVYLEEGVYNIVAICMVGNSYAHPRKLVKIEAKSKYNFKCVTEYSKNFLGMDKPDKATLVVEKI